MAETTTTAKSGPKIVQMPRAVHELITGPKPEQKIDAGDFIDDAVAKENKLDDKAIKSLTASGAVELVDILKG